MPATGGLDPGPERYGGGEVPGSNVPLLQRVFESVAAQRGSAYDQTVSSTVGIENLAYARAVTFDGYGTNQRLANQFLPSKMTADGLLPRWERIFGLSVPPTDLEVVRRARVAAAFAAVGQGNQHQVVADALTNALGPVFTGTIGYQDPNTANAIWGSDPHTGVSNNPQVPWSSSIDHIDIVCTFRVKPFYTPISLPANSTQVRATPAWYTLLGQAQLVLDAILPAWMTWSFVVASSHGTLCFYLDEDMNLDYEIFCT